MSYNGLSRYISDVSYDRDLIDYNYNEYDGCITKQSETYEDGEHVNNVSDFALKQIKRNIRRNRRIFLRACAYGSPDDIEKIAYALRGQITIPWYLAFKTASNTNTIESITYISDKCHYYNFYCDMRPICDSLVANINATFKVCPLYDINITSIIVEYVLRL